MISERSAEKLEEESKSKIKTFKYLPIGPAASFKGASKYFSELRNKYPSHLKITVFPQDLNFHAIEVCVPVYQTFTLKNTDKMRNIEVAAITSESSQISIEHDLEDHMIIRPGKKVTIKVTVIAQLKGKFY